MLRDEKQVNDGDDRPSAAADADGEPPTHHKKTNRLDGATEGVEKHIERIRELHADMTKNDTWARYAIGEEVKEIHKKDGETGMKKAAKILKRSYKTLYEYEAVTETWDKSAFKRISSEVGPSGNTLMWTDFVELARVTDKKEREKVRKQALAENKSVKTMKRAKSRLSAQDVSAQTRTEGGPHAALMSAVCQIMNASPELSVSITAVVILLEHGVPEATPNVRQICLATVDHLEKLIASATEVMPMLRRFGVGVAEEPAAADSLPGCRNDGDPTGAEEVAKTAGLDGPDEDVESDLGADGGNRTPDIAVGRSAPAEVISFVRAAMPSVAQKGAD